MNSPTVETLWDSCLRTIRENVNQQSFKTWFQPIQPIKLEESVLTIQVPSQFFYEWLEEHYVVLLRKTIKRELGERARLEYRIVVNENGNGGNPFTIDAPNRAQASDESNSVRGQHSGMGTAIKNPFVIPGIKKVEIDSQLNPNYLFDNFVEGECNQLGRSAGFAVANKPGGTAFNPLVLYGGVGLGKTHLAQAIGNYVKSNFQSKSVLYVSSEKFTNQFIEAVKQGSINDFIHFYQLIDLLIVDDIQFFGEKERTQDIFFHIFNHLHQSGKQIVLTSDRPPKDLVGMEERLLSRFKWGLTTDLQVPDFETRMAILEQKMSLEGVELPHEVVEYVAYNIDTSIRELEGALISLIAQSSLTRKDIDLSLAKKIVKSFVNNIIRDISVDFIQQTVCEHMEVDREKIVGKTRKREIVQARQIAMYFCKQYTDKSLKSIGSAFGGRDHSTVIHSCNAVQDQLDTDKEYHRNLVQIEKVIRMSMA
ncbi:chromosomal replication initiator protein DnaA [Chitinophagales bacterium]|nr:chromosomal replication initiator protein DnaA [Chitinophagales bacterium]